MRYLLIFLIFITGCQEPPKIETSKAIEFVHSEAMHISKLTSVSHYAFYAALSAMNYIQTNISSVRNNLAITSPGYTAPSGTEYCLVEKRGICGNHVEAFIDILSALKVPARPVQIYYEKDNKRYSHIVAEVEWSGRWHMFDVTWGFIPHNGNPFEALSFTEARQRGTDAGLHNYANTWRVYYSKNKSLFDYLTLGDVVIDGTGVISPPLSGNKFSFAHFPNYIGRTKLKNGSVGEISMQILHQGNLTITPSAISCKHGYITSGDQSVPITSKPITLKINANTLSVKSDSEICYVVIKEMNLS